MNHGSGLGSRGGALLGGAPNVDCGESESDGAQPSFFGAWPAKQVRKRKVPTLLFIFANDQNLQDSEPLVNIYFLFVCR